MRQGGLAGLFQSPEITAGFQEEREMTGAVVVPRLIYTLCFLFNRLPGLSDKSNLVRFVCMDQGINGQRRDDGVNYGNHKESHIFDLEWP